MPENNIGESLSINEMTGRKWLRRWGIDLDEYVKEFILGIKGPNYKLFDLNAEKILAEQWLMWYAIAEYEKGRGLTVNEFLRMLIDVESRPIAEFPTSTS